MQVEKQKIYCMFSGGRDSALACFIAKRVADIRGMDFKLVFIDTGTALPGVREYVNEYAKWLDAELVILHAKIDYWEGVERWGYPLLWSRRWCIDYLKRIPFFEYVRQNVKGHDIVVMGIRKSESKFRFDNFSKTFYTYCYKKFSICLNLWLPLLNIDDAKLNVLIRKFNIPISPVWTRVGISGECMCMAGTPKRTLIKVIVNYPDYAKMLAEKDRLIQQHRRNGKPAFTGALYHDKITLHEFIEHVLNNSLMNYLSNDNNEEMNESCPGTCLI